MNNCDCVFPAYCGQKFKLSIGRKNLVFNVEAPSLNRHFYASLNSLNTNWIIF